MAQKERVQKILAAYGVASRRKAEELISANRVTVNGNPVKLGDSAYAGKDRIEVDGKIVLGSRDVKKIYLALHKPRGFVTTMSDERNRKCVAMLVEDVGARVYPVGRLDKDSEGLLLMTNDGDFANLISHPKSHVSKTYRVTVRPSVTEEQLTRLSTGVMVDGQMTAPAGVKVLEQEPGRVVLQMVLYEGRNREIRKMCGEVGLEVVRLKRIAIGKLKLGMLQQGKYRELTSQERNDLIAESKKSGGANNDRDTANNRPKRREKAYR